MNISIQCVKILLSKLYSFPTYTLKCGISGVADVGDELCHCWEMCGKLMRIKCTEMEFYKLVVVSKVLHLQESKKTWLKENDNVAYKTIFRKISG
jgi:hypothetical protein